MAVRLLPHGHRCRSLRVGPRAFRLICCKLESQSSAVGAPALQMPSLRSASQNTAWTSTSAFVDFFALLMCPLLFLFLLPSLLSPFPPLPIPPLFPHFSILSRLFYLCLFLLSMLISFLSLLSLLSSSSTCSLLSPRFP